MSTLLSTIPELTTWVLEGRWMPTILGHRFRYFCLSMAILLFLVSRIKKFKDSRRAMNYMPGMYIPFQPYGLPSLLFPSTWSNPGVTFPWNERFRFYKRLSLENIAVYPYIHGGLSIYTSNMEIGRQVMSGGPNSSFVKPRLVTDVLMLTGMNILAADGETWRRHRRILGPAFTNDLYRKVWDETVNIYHQWTAAEDWDDKDIVSVPALQDITLKVTLLLISRCGLGLPFSWTAPPTAPDGSMSMQEALRTFHEVHNLLIFAPKWIFSLPIPGVKAAWQSYQQLMSFMKDKIAERKLRLRGDVKSQTDDFVIYEDVFTTLVKANEDELTKYKLNDNELIGNVWVMLFAGHETTAHGLSATLALLALHPEIQQEIYEEIISVVGHDRDPVFGDFSRLEKVLGAFYEGLRMFPSAFLMIRQAAQDAVIQVPNPPGKEGTTALHVQKGVRVIIDMIGIQNNPRYFDEPEKFLPSRWYGRTSSSHDVEAFFGFSLGTRACLGRKFAESEAVAFFVMILRTWKVEPLLRDGETMEQWENRSFDVNIVLSLGLKDVGVKFTRRTVR